MKIKKEKYNYHLSLTEEQLHALQKQEHYFRDQATLGKKVRAIEVVKFIDDLGIIVYKWSREFNETYSYIISDALRLFFKYDFSYSYKKLLGENEFYPATYSLNDMLNNIFWLIYEKYYDPEKIKEPRNIESLSVDLKQQLFTLVYTKITSYRNKLKPKQRQSISDYFAGALAGYITHSFGHVIMSPTSNKVVDYFQKSRSLISKAKVICN